MLVAIDHVGTDLDCQVYEVTLIILMDRLIALCIGLFDDFSDIGILCYSTVDIKKQSLSFSCVELADDSFYFYLL